MDILSRKSSIGLLTVLAVILVAINAMVAYRSVAVLEHSQSWVQHTYQVIAQVEIIMGSEKDAETGERGFLITGDPRFLEPYSNAERDLPAELDAFQQLTSDNASQQSRLAQLRSHLVVRNQLLEHAINLRRGGSSMAQAALAVTEQGKAEMDILRRIGKEMQSEEYRLLTDRLVQARRADIRTRITVAVATILDLILLVIMSRYLYRERELRYKTELQATELREANERIIASTAEIHELNETLELRVKQRTSELEATNRELEAFSYSVSHDLRAPLRTVDGFSLALEEDYAEAVDAVGKDYIRRIRAGVQRMGQLIDALLQLSRITRAEVETSEFDLSALADSVASTLVQENPGRQIDFRIEPGLTATGDPRLIRVALENLFGNSVKFTSRLPSALIEFGRDPAQNAYFVRDNGAGFDMAYADRLFSAFHRLHGDKDFKGSGIGLATVSRIIHRHHGKIWAYSEVDRGATFFFSLE
ncbi:sensor histidine kinase [Occallatibacter savannae]|uniref:sensor histidine kinase n=1 Tax=Occallatibacter savannae TaxID=1002691 RepID=UPI000D68A5FA|nr:sensor histidine kinase [Occallatibacter savannae]